MQGELEIRAANKHVVMCNPAGNRFMIGVPKTQHVCTWMSLQPHSRYTQFFIFYHLRKTCFTLQSWSFVFGKFKAEKIHLKCLVIRQMDLQIATLGRHLQSSEFGPAELFCCFMFGTTKVFIIYQTSLSFMLSSRPFSDFYSKAHIH